MPTYSAVSFSSPSGAGKSTIIKGLLELFPMLQLSVSMTTRAPRPGEVDGVHYYFRPVAEFESLCWSGGFLEYEEVYPGKFYGTPKAELDRIRRAEKIPLLDLDVEGALKMKQVLKNDLLAVFVQVPLRIIEKRLIKRGTEDEQSLSVRLEKAKHELAKMNQFNRIVTNSANDNGAHAIWHSSKIIKNNFLFPVTA